MAGTREKYERYVSAGFTSGIEPLVVSRAEGARLLCEDGRSYIDCFAGIFVVNAGHVAPEVASIGVLRRDDLPSRAARLGNAAMHDLRAQAKDLGGIGEVRGLGLMIGVEHVQSLGSRTPDPQRARDVRRRCREAGVLIGVGGIDGNVLRIQPPLVITEADLGEALGALGAALRAFPPSA